MREVGDIEGLDGLAAATETRQVGHQRVELVAEQLGGGQQVASGEAEAVHVHHGRSRRR
jgi:hypothetical protein